MYFLTNTSRFMLDRLACVRELKNVGVIEVKWVSTKENESDMFTKNLDGCVCFHRDNKGENEVIKDSYQFPSTNDFLLFGVPLESYKQDNTRYQLDAILDNDSKGTVESCTEKSAHLSKEKAKTVQKVAEVCSLRTTPLS